MWLNKCEDSATFKPFFKMNANYGFQIAKYVNDVIQNWLLIPSFHWFSTILAAFLNDLTYSKPRLTIPAAFCKFANAILFCH
jgi:hypothetical protein